MERGVVGGGVAVGVGRRGRLAGGLGGGGVLCRIARAGVRVIVGAAGVGIVADLRVGG